MNNPHYKSPWLIVLLSGTTFFYFLIFAQFGYLQLLGSFSVEGKLIDSAMLAMGIGGIGGSIYAARKFQILHAQRWIIIGFTGSGLSAVTAVFMSITWIHVGIAFAIGLFLGILTVAIVPVIRALAPFGRVGIWVSSGVGVAYFLCNVPFVFDSSAVDLCLFGVFACCLGLSGTFFLPVFPQSVLQLSNEDDKSPLYLFQLKGILIITVFFTVLIWMDSAAFYLIQESDVIRSKTWGSDWQLWMNATVHLMAAISGGWLLDKGWIFRSLPIAFALLTGGYLLVEQVAGGAGIGAVLYVAGVSIYSTALVGYGALAAEGKGTWTISLRAGMVFAVGGWFGSAMGVGMARDLGRIPMAFIAITLGISFACLLFRYRIHRSEKEFCS